MSDSHHPFKQLAAIDVSPYVEKKGQFTYLSWPYAVAQLRLADPEARWEVRRFDGLPYLVTEIGYFVEVAVIVQGLTLSQIHPVLDGRNKPITQPTVFDINTSIQRALVKAIALHGLGLNVYAGEDLPTHIEEGGELLTKPTDHAPSPVSAIVGQITEKQLRYIQHLISVTGSDAESLLAYFGFESLESIPRNYASRVISALETKKRAA
jgi:Protein of unknown function (DUF1071)